MNVRIENNHMRFKISEDELGELLNGKLLETNALMKVKIQPCEDSHTISAQQSIYNDVITLTLSVPKQSVSELLKMGKNRDGLRVEQGDLSLSLQVDIRKDSRKKDRAI